MKFHFISFLSLLLFTTCSLHKQINHNIAPSNSFESELVNTEINYSYDKKNQTHNYSNNWDFDGDSILDTLLFIGNNAANIRYNLLIKLSSNDSVFLFSSFYINFPLIEPITSLNNNNIYPQFIVNDFNDDGIEDIFLKIDTSYSSKWKENYNKIVLFYNNKNIKFTYSEYK